MKSGSSSTRLAWKRVGSKSPAFRVGRSIQENGLRKLFPQNTAAVRKRTEVPE